MSEEATHADMEEGRKNSFHREKPKNPALAILRVKCLFVIQVEKC